jgi:cephalosporin hydroxylase
MLDLDASIHEQRHCQNAEGMCKTAADVARYRTVIERTDPDGIIEIGTYSGKSAVWFARTAGCPVLTIDVQHTTVDADTLAAAQAAQVTLLLGRSTSPSVIDSTFAWARHKRRIMVSVDGDHSGPVVAAEMNAYSPLVKPDGYMIVEDGIVRWLPEQWPYYTGNPLDAIETFLAAHPEWANDQELEDSAPTTQFPGGFLRRLR